MKKKRSQKSLQEAKARGMEHEFYLSVYSYIIDEYNPRIATLFTDSPISGTLVDLINKYFWGGNTIPSTAGDIADLLRSKYKES